MFLCVRLDLGYGVINIGNKPSWVVSVKFVVEVFDCPWMGIAILKCFVKCVVVRELFKLSSGR